MTKWTVEEVLKEIRQKDKKALVIIQKNGHKIHETTADYVPGPLSLLPVKSYCSESRIFLIFFRKTKYVIELLK